MPLRDSPPGRAGRCLKYIMKELIRYEIKKILDRKVNRITLLLGLALIVFSNLILINSESLQTDENTSCTGREAILRQAELENALTDVLDEEFLTDFLADYQRRLSEVSTDPAFQEPAHYLWSLIGPYSNLFSLIADNYREWNAHFAWEDLAEIPTEGGVHFYERRMEKTDNMLEADYTWGTYSLAEKDFWRQKAQSVPTPFRWGNRNVWDRIQESIALLIWLLFVISICIAPIFSGEYQSRTDALLLSCRHGKGRLVHAKIAAAFLFTFSYVLFCALVSTGINVVLLGVQGYDLPVQIFNTIIPYDWTILQLCAVNLLVILLLFVLLTGSSLLLSAICKNPMTVLILDILLFYGTLFIPSSKTSWLWNHIFCLLPLHCFNMKDVLKMYISYPLGNKVISYLGMILLSYSLLSLLCVLFTGRFFRNHQVGG